jgi:N-acetylglucosamine-6-phosphate deacetylase
MKIFGKLCATGQLVEIEISNAQITSITPANAAAGVLPSGALGGADVWISPGWIDLQFNGYGGYDFNRRSWTTGDSSDEAPHKIVELAARGGTAMLCPTIVTNSREGIIESLEFLARSVESDKTLAAALPAFHVEGPYISSEEGLRGAHPLEHTRDPDWDEFQQFQDAAGGRVKILTLAPERAGCTEFIERATESGVVVSIGHSGATPENIQDAVKAGARLSTHLGNGSQNMIQRHRNYFFEQLASDEMTACIIADGHHLPAELVKIIARVKPPEKLVLVSDAVALGGQPAGIYDEGRHEVLPSGKVVLAGTPYLAGAGHLLDTCAANYLRWTSGGKSELVKAIACNPAQILGFGSSGQIAVGHDADVTLFRDTATGPLDIVATITKGETLYRAT